MFDGPWAHQPLFFLYIAHRTFENTHTHLHIAHTYLAKCIHKHALFQSHSYTPGAHFGLVQLQAADTKFKTKTTTTTMTSLK